MPICVNRSSLFIFNAIFEMFFEKALEKLRKKVSEWNRMDLMNLKCLNIK